MIYKIRLSMKTLSLLKPALAAIIATAICALAVLGCGGSSSSADQTAGDGGSSKAAASSETNSTLTKSEFLKQANAVCANVEKEVQGKVAAYLKSKGIKEIGEGKSPDEAEAQQSEVVEKFGLPALRKQQTEIEALGPPSQDEAQVKAYLAALEEGIEEGERKPALVYSSSLKALAASDKIAAELGLKACSNR